MSAIHQFLHKQWTQFCLNQAIPASWIAEEWQKLWKKYHQSNRHYHNEQHIQAIWTIITRYESKLINPIAVKWAVFYHDIIYKALRKDNELKSAIYAQNSLGKVIKDKTLIALVYQLIIATKTHEALQPTHDFYYFLDADLAILGTTRKQYEKYINAIRKEYHLFPDFLYRKGRRKVLTHFLAKENLYYTLEMRRELEEKARENLVWELRRL